MYEKLGTGVRRGLSARFGRADSGVHAALAEPDVCRFARPVSRLTCAQKLVRQEQHLAVSGIDSGNLHRVR
jgi:hypothetical protein